MSANEHRPRPASTPQEPPPWEQWLYDVARPWYPFVILGSVLLATGEVPFHLPGALQRLANIAVIAEFVVFLPVASFLIVRATRRNPATSWSWAWGMRLLVASALGGGVLVAYGFITGLLPDWQRSQVELLVLVVLGSILCILVSLGLVLVVVAVIGEAWQSMRARYRRPPANTGS